MVVKVHCGTVLGDAFSTWRQIRSQNSPTMHFDNHLDLVSHATSKWRIETAWIHFLRDPVPYDLEL